MSEGKIVGETVGEQKLSSDFILGMLLNRTDAHEAKFVETDKQIALLRNDMVNLNASVTVSIGKVVDKVDEMLKAQTEELKPLITEKTVRDANAAASRAKQEYISVFWQKVGGIIAVLVFLLGVISFAYNVHPKTTTTLSETTKQTEQTP
jgi:chemotaxis signal transduction protein